MKAYIFFSVHEELFHLMAERLRDQYGVTSFSGFTWGKAQTKALEGRGIDYDPVVFSRDLLPKYGDAPPDLAWLARREQELGVSIQRMLAAERHLLAGRSFEQIMRIAEVALREIAAAYDRIKPDFAFSEDLSCFHSYAHWAVARERGIPFYCIGGARLPYRVAVYKSGIQHYETIEARHAAYKKRLDPAARAAALAYVTEFRDKPRRPSGMATRAATPGVGKRDLATLRLAADRYFADPGDPTTEQPLVRIGQRLRRIARIKTADALGVFEQPVPGERYVLYPIHYQPEASTLVQAPMYLDQVQLLEDMAKSLPVGVRLYVKEHVSNRGRRPLSFYRAIQRIPSVRLLGPDADTWALIKDAAAIAVITGTMGWEGLIFDKPVVTFGDVFYNAVAGVYRAGDAPKDRWYELFQRALTSHVPDPEALLAYIAALQAESHPGFIASPISFPEVIEPDNVRLLVEALALHVGLTTSPARREAPAPAHR